MKIKLHQPRLRLTDLLRRRKMSLDKFLSELGISSFEELKNRCTRMGVTPPSEEEFKLVRPAVIEDPSEGVVVIPAPIIISERTGEEVEPDVVIADPAPEDDQPTLKKSGKRKKSQMSETE